MMKKTLQKLDEMLDTAMSNYREAKEPSHKNTFLALALKCIKSKSDLLRDGGFTPCADSD